MKKEKLKTKLLSIGVNFFLVLACLYGESGCSHTQNNKVKVVATQSQNGFTLPDIPHMLTTGEERAAYLVAHYWDNFDFIDTTQISKPEITEQIFVDFLDILPHVPLEKGKEALTLLMDSASADSTMFSHFIKLTEKYLYDPNSPFYNESFYLPILNYIVSSSKLDEIHKVRPRYLLKTILKNCAGNKATDFSYTLSTGTVAMMSSIKADYTILFFNNPDCNECKRAKDYIKHSEVFNRLVRSDSTPSLRILAIYPDEDLSLWKRADYPDIMINGYDAGQVITKKDLYDLKAIPTFYLLDKEKWVILKDVRIEQIEAWLQML